MLGYCCKNRLGKLTSDFMQEGSKNTESFVAEKLGKFINNDESLQPKDVILYGLVVSVVW